MPLISVNGTELFHDFAGPAGAPVVVFSNSIGTTLEMWDEQARALAGRLSGVAVRHAGAWAVGGAGRAGVDRGPGG